MIAIGNFTHTGGKPCEKGKDELARVVSGLDFVETCSYVLNDGNARLVEADDIIGGKATEVVESEGGNDQQGELAEAQPILLGEDLGLVAGQDTANHADDDVNDEDVGQELEGENEGVDEDIRVFDLDGCLGDEEVDDVE